MTWRNPINRADIEQALDTGQLFMDVTLRAGPPRFWLIRRNGQTKTWKRSPDWFRIPVKYGFKGYDQIDHNYPKELMRIANSRQEAETGVR
jgi:hypothetical protein